MDKSRISLCEACLKEISRIYPRDSPGAGAAPTPAEAAGCPGGRARVDAPRAAGEPHHGQHHLTQHTGDHYRLGENICRYYKA